MDFIGIVQKIMGGLKWVQIACLVYAAFAAVVASIKFFRGSPQKAEEGTDKLLNIGKGVLIVCFALVGLKWIVGNLLGYPELVANLIG